MAQLPNPNSMRPIYVLEMSEKLYNIEFYGAALYYSKFCKSVGEFYLDLFKGVKSENNLLERKLNQFAQRADSVMKESKKRVFENQQSLELLKHLIDNYGKDIILRTY